MNTKVVLELLRKRYLTLPLGGEVLSNALLAMSPYGLDLLGQDPRVIAKKILEEKLTTSEATRMNVREAYVTLSKVTMEMVKQLKRFRQPRAVGIQLQWRPLQIDALDALISLYQKGYTHIGMQLPTGSGKTNLLAAISVAHQIAFQQLSPRVQTAVYTSNISIGKQMVEKPDGSPGDFSRWLDLIAGPNNGSTIIRTLIGDDRNRASEWKNPNANVSIFSYQGMGSNKTLADFHKTIVGLQLHDEADCESETFHVMRPQSGMVSVSATMSGKKGWDPFLLCDPVVPENDPFFKKGQLFIEGDIERAYLSLQWQRYLAVAISMREGIERDTLCGIRCISLDVFGETKVKAALAHLIHQYEGNALKAAKEVLRDPEVILGALKTLYLDEKDYFTSFLKSLGQPIPGERTALFFVQRVDLAERMVDEFNTKLAPLVKGKFKISLEAAYVSGDSTPEEYERAITGLLDPKSPIKVLFSVDKIGRGTDLPQVDLVLPFDIYSEETAREMYQKIGRGTRKFQTYSKKLKMLIEKDLLLVEINPGFISEGLSPIASVCDMATVATPEQPGSLLLGVWERRKIELSFTQLLLQQGKSIQEALDETAKAFKKDMQDPQFKDLFTRFIKSVTSKNEGGLDKRLLGSRPGIANIGVQDITVLPLTKLGAGISGKRLEDPRRFAQTIVKVLQSAGIFSLERLEQFQLQALGSTPCNIFGSVRHMVRHVLHSDTESGNARLTEKELQEFIAYLRQWSFPEKEKDVEGVEVFDIFLEQISSEEVEENYYGRLHDWLRNNYGKKPIINCPQTPMKTRGQTYYPASLSCEVILKEGEVHLLSSATFKNVRRTDALRMAARDLLAKINEVPNLLTIEDDEFVLLAQDAQRELIARDLKVEFSACTIENKMLTMICTIHFSHSERRIRVVHDPDDYEPLMKVKAFVQYGAWARGCDLATVARSESDLVVHPVAVTGYQILHEEVTVLDPFGLGEEYSIVSLKTRIACGDSEYDSTETGNNVHDALKRTLDIVQEHLTNEFSN